MHSCNYKNNNSSVSYAISSHIYKWENAYELTTTGNFEQFSKVKDKNINDHKTC